MSPRPRNAPLQKCRFSRKTIDKMIPFVDIVQRAAPIFICHRDFAADDNDEGKEKDAGRLILLLFEGCAHRDR